MKECRPLTTRKRAIRVVLAVCAAGLLPDAALAGTLKVVASFSVLADVAKHVGGDHVDVKTLVPPNGDPHEYEPTPDDAKALKAADLAFVSGFGLEGWFARLAAAAGAKGQPVTVSDGITAIVSDKNGRTRNDPHVWNNPSNVRVWVKNIEKALVAADAADAATFHANAKAYDDVLVRLDAYAHAKIDPIPVDRRKVLTSHDAFAYFGHAYGVTFLSPLGVSTETEASAAGVAKLIDQVRREHVKVYFFENSNDPRVVKQIAAATGAEPGGALYVESLSQPDGPAPTYEKMFQYNVDKLADAMKR